MTIKLRILQSHTEYRCVVYEAAKYFKNSKRFCMDYMLFSKHCLFKKNKKNKECLADYNSSSNKCFF